MGHPRVVPSGTIAHATETGEPYIPESEGARVINIDIRRVVTRQASFAGSMSTNSTRTLPPCYSGEIAPDGLQNNTPSSVAPGEYIPQTM